ncbi:glycosyltransferase 87 family protein [Kitasatospora sp. NPDC051853]|uniref:glycosyltransferase 87 family protein n=1 Tax=Kitasatospora sp. NPDC051853 TaxID=3364058 RepID=UPI0037AB5994
MSVLSPRPVGQVPVRPADGRWPGWCLPLLLASAVAAMAVGLSSPPGTAQRWWGVIAGPGYGVAALVALGSRARWGRGAAVVAVLGSLVVPLVWLTVLGRAQMEVGVIERGARLLLDTGTPYLHAPQAVKEFNPYLPGMSVFGLPAALFGGGALAGARLWLVLGTLAALVWSVRLVATAPSADGASAVGSDRLTRLLWVVACPVVALPLAIGGVDPPVIALLCLALAFARRGEAGQAGLVAGLAAALKWTAWPAVPVLLVLFAVRSGRRAAVRFAAAAGAVALVAVVPVLLVDPEAFRQSVLLYPFGLSDTTSTAASPLLGQLLVTLLPAHGKAVAVVLIGLSAVAVGVSLVVRPPRDVTAAAGRLALGLLLAILLSPATRIGYAVYPVVLYLWPRLFLTERTERTGRTPDAALAAPEDARAGGRADGRVAAQSS